MKTHKNPRCVRGEREGGSGNRPSANPTPRCFLSSAQLAWIPDGEERLLIATGRYIGEGFDDARLDTLFLALPVSWGTLIQYTGRLHCLHRGKTEVRIFDYVDRAAPILLKMFERRLLGHRALGYARDVAPLGLQEVEDDAVIEYDEEVLRTLEDET